MSNWPIIVDVKNPTPAPVRSSASNVQAGAVRLGLGLNCDWLGKLRVLERNGDTILTITGQSAKGLLSLFKTRTTLVRCARWATSVAV